jgi:hypothetical protein
MSISSTTILIGIAKAFTDGTRIFRFQGLTFCSTFSMCEGEMGTLGEVRELTYMPNGYAPLGGGPAITQCAFGSRADRKGSHSRCAQGLRKEVRWEVGGGNVKDILIVSRGVRRIIQFGLWCTVYVLVEMWVRFSTCY